MTRAILGAGIGIGIAIVLSSGVLARQAPPAANVPGMPVVGRSVIVNGPNEPLPVVVAGGSQTQPVTVVGTSSVTVVGEPVVIARAGRQGWEYRSVSVATGEDPAEALVVAGIEGWEAVGVIAAANGGTRVLLKRPR
ncbi:MAG: hypothetical protein ABS36_04215 [Acidobacteria bacterium SCN 69-37]|nr:MAG: hypothetical protein ABS36_04215 [Acidobacteria bacterium SCN 69-37]